MGVCGTYRRSTVEWFSNDISRWHGNTTNSLINRKVFSLGRRLQLCLPPTGMMGINERGCGCGWGSGAGTEACVSWNRFLSLFTPIYLIFANGEKTFSLRQTHISHPSALNPGVRLEENFIFFNLMKRLSMPRPKYVINFCKK